MNCTCRGAWSTHPEGYDSHMLRGVVYTCGGVWFHMWGVWSTCEERSLHMWRGVVCTCAGVWSTLVKGCGLNMQSGVVCTYGG